MTLPARPALARRARLRWDAVRGSHTLLVPESVVTLTPEAAEVLALCDGTRTVEAVVTALCQQYAEAPEDTVREDVTNLLTRLVDRGYVVDAP